LTLFSERVSLQPDIPSEVIRVLPAFFFTPGILHGLYLAPCLVTADQFAPLGLLITLFNMGRQRRPFLVGPVFLGILLLKRTPQDVFDIRVNCRWTSAC
jgi:hypothetical protein